MLGGAQSQDRMGSKGRQATQGVPRSGGLTYTPGLDGLRAVALLAIIAYHVGFSWIQGAYNSVDTFFVLSGYLITSLLVVEWRGSGSIALRKFWARRARRLLPALFVLIAAMGVVHLVDPGLIPWLDPIPDAAATLGYVANWHFIGASASYWASTDQSPLLHTWTLAIEEQFYLVWPLVVLLVLRASRPSSRRNGSGPDRVRRLTALLCVSVTGAVASALWMWHLTPPTASIIRAYYGTDTRAQSLLVGASIAIALQLHQVRHEGVAPLRHPRRWAMVLSVGGLAGTAAVWYFVPETSSLAFHGGFLLASLASGAIVLAVVVAPLGAASRVLSLRALRYIGTISYGAYLWYWPVFLVVQKYSDRLGMWPFYASETAVTLGLAALSAKFIEMPIRRGSISSWRALVGAPVAAAASFCLVVVSTTVGLPALTPSAAGAVSAVAGTLNGHSAPPVRVLLVGDSMAGTLGATLAQYAPQYDIELINEGRPGCSVSSDSEFRFLLYITPPGPPCEIGNPRALLDAWQTWVDEYRPNVVVYLGRTDLFNQDLDGSWTWIGHPRFDSFYSNELREGLSILSSRGAKVVLMTSPYYDSTINTASPPVPEDAPDRVATDDRILERAAASSPGVSVFDLGQLVDPDGHYAQEVDGVNMRCTDGVHFSWQAGRVIAPRLLPYLVGVGRSAKVPVQGDPPALPAAVPSWYEQLQCGQP
jgi:peptidoglycan/LPS O-acetylase OafA/YrhL